MGKMRFLAAFMTAVLLVSMVTCQNCEPPTGKTTLPVAFQAADTSSDYIYIGGLFGIHEKGSTPYECGRVRERGIQNLEAFFWALRTFPGRLPLVLTDVSVGGFAFDSCSDADKLIAQILNLENCYVPIGSPAIQPSHVLGFVGPDTSDQAMRVAPILGDMRKSVVSHAASSSILSDDKYDNLFRTVPSDIVQVGALIGILKEQEWSYVQVVKSDNAYGRSGASEFRKAAKDAGICVVNTEIIPLNYSDSHIDDIIDGLRENAGTRAIVLFANDLYVHAFLEGVKRKKARGEFTWIGTNSWATNSRVTEGVEDEAEGAITLGLDASGRTVDDFRYHFNQLKPETNSHNPWFKEYWQQRFNCYLPGQSSKGYTTECDTQTQSLQGFSMDTYVPYTIKAVDALLKGIEAARRTQCPSTYALCSRFINNDARWGIIREEIGKVEIPGVIKFNRQTGDTSIARHDVYNFRRPYSDCPDFCYTKIGTFEEPQTLSRINGRVYFYDQTGGRIPKPDSLCAASPCTACSDVILTTNPVTLTTTTATTGGNVASTAVGSEMSPPTKIRQGVWIIALIILAGLGVLLTIIFEIYLMSKMLCTSFAKHWRTMWLGQLLLLAVFLCYLTLFAFVPTPTNVTCAIIRFGVGGSYSMCFAVLLVKLMIIISSKNVGYLKGVYQILMFIFAWGVQLVLDAEWLILRPPLARQDNSSGTVEWVCDQGFVPHVQSLVYVMFLILITTMIAMRAHGIITNHREGIFIGLTCGFTIPVWIAWVLLGLLSTNTAFRDPCLAFGLFITATLVLFIMYMPKVRQLNSMGVEGIYAEDDVPEYAASLVPSIAAPASVVAGSVVYGPPSYKSKTGSVVYVNGGIYSDPLTGKTQNYHYDGDANALYLRHPGTLQVPPRPASVRSAPVGGGIYTLPRREPAPDSLYATTRVLRMTGDLTGRKAVSDYGDVGDYGTLRSNASVQGSSIHGTLKKPKSLQDLGSL